MPPLDNDDSAKDDIGADILSAFKEQAGSDAPANEPVKAEETPAEKPVDKSPVTDKVADKTDDTIEPPARFTKEEKDEWAKLDAGVRRILNQRNKSLEGHWTKEFQSVAATKKYADEVRGIIDTHRDRWKASGMTDAQAVRQMMDVSKFATDAPEQFIAQFAQNRGQDLVSIAAKVNPQGFSKVAASMGYVKGGAESQQQGQAGNPTPLSADMQMFIDAVTKKFGTIEQVIGQQQQHWQTQQQQAQQAVQQQANTTLSDFMSATDASGNAKYPYVNDVRGDMAKLMQAGLADTLEQAYTKAVRARDDLYEKQVQADRTSWARDQEKRDREAALAARSAGSSVGSGSTATGARVPDGEDDDDDIGAILGREMAKMRGGNSRI